MRETLLAVTAFYASRQILKLPPLLFVATARPLD